MEVHVYAHHVISVKQVFLWAGCVCLHYNFS